MATGSVSGELLGDPSAEGGRWPMVRPSLHPFRSMEATAWSSCFGEGVVRVPGRREPGVRSNGRERLAAGHLATAHTATHGIS